VKGIYQYGVMLFLLGGVILLAGCRKENPQEMYDLNKPLPVFLQELIPAPGSTLSLESYQSGDHYDGSYPLGSTPNRICAKINPEPLLEPGDFYGSRNRIFEFLPNRLTVSVDGEELAWNVEELVVILGMYQLRDEDGEVVAQTGGPQVPCWVAELKRGEHVAVMKVTKTSGETIEYAWSFTLLD
jgi:hypothetical protein